MIKKIPSWLIATTGILATWAIYSRFGVNHEIPIASALNAERKEFYGVNSTLLSYYVQQNSTKRPLVLLHSINAAANAYEMQPLFEHYQDDRPVYVLDLPGFGFSDRSNRDYSIDLYVSAITDFLRDVVAEPADVIALSLTSEFSAIVAHQAPELFNSLTLISPTGMSKKGDVSQQHKDDKSVYNILNNSLWSQPLYDLLVTRLSLRYFLGMNFVGDIDQGLLNYHYASSHQLGARYAPLTFISGALFTRTIFDDIYQNLTVPTLILYDTDPNVSFDSLPELLRKNSHWRARRILNTRGLPHFERLDMAVDAINVFWADIE